MSTSAIAVEIGGTKLQACLGDTAGQIFETRRGSVPEGANAERILSWFEESVPELLALATSRGAAPATLGVGFGGPVDAQAGLTLVSHQVAGWDGFPLQRWFEERFGLRTRLANDANAAGWAEYCLGAGQGTRHFFYMNIGSGIGGALVLDRRLHNGQGLGAGEIGHTCIADWTAPHAGASDKLEHLCSGWSIEQRMRHDPHAMQSAALRALAHDAPATLTCAMLAAAAEAGDAYAIETIHRVAEGLGQAVANVITLFHPERIAVGGGVGLMGETLLAPLRAAVAQRVFGPFRDHYTIVPCALGESVVLAGALLLSAE